MAASEAHIQWVRDHVTSEPALAFAEALQTANSSSSGAFLRAAADDAGVTSCRFADHLDDPDGLHRMWGSTD